MKMEEKELTSVSQQENVTDNVDYIEALREMKQNTVDKAAYEKLRSENQKLINTIVHGGELDTPVKAEEPVDIGELRKKLFNEDSSLSNLEYAKVALQLREELIKQGKPDPFLPCGKNIKATEDDEAKAERVAAALKDCVEYADGDTEIFTNELQRIMVDSAPISRRR